jgi:hypothetical protein
MRSAFLVAISLLAILWRAPAGLMDEVARRISAGQVRLTSADGTLWRGRGIVEVVDRATRSWSPWREIEWIFAPAALLHGRVGWQIASGNKPIVRAEVSSSAWYLTQLDVDGPASLFLSYIPNELGRLGWSGDVALGSPAVRCTWRGVCDGYLDVHWLNAGSDLLPERAFGDYELEAEAVSGNVSLRWRTSRGRIRIDGQGHLSAAGKATLKATIAGDPTLLRHLTAVAGPWAKPTDNPGVWNLVY